MAILSGYPGEVRKMLIQLDTGIEVLGRSFLNGKPEKAYVHLDGDAGPVSGVMIQTDADGHFAFHGVLPGEYSIRSCTADGTAIWSETLSLTINDDAPEPLELFIRAPFQRVSGRIQTADGQPLVNHDVFVFPGRETSGILAGMAKSRPDGSFEVRIKPGKAESFTIAIPWDELVDAAVRVIKRRLAGDRSVASHQILNPRPVVRRI